MADVDVNIAIKTIQDPSCLHLQQSLVMGAPEVMEPSTEVPGGWEFLHSLLKRSVKKKSDK